MKAVVQRITRASVVVEGEIVGKCGKGFLVLIAVHTTDTDKDPGVMADRIWGMRIFSDPDGKMNRSLKELAETEPVGVLAVSNFTVYGDTSRNRRPSFFESASYDRGKELYDRFVEELRQLGCHVETGIYGADMEVTSVIDGPVTVLVEVRDGKPQ
jgi:D-aminoacyl-tRNA deacylase